MNYEIINFTKKIIECKTTENNQDEIVKCLKIYLKLKKIKTNF